MLRVVNVVFLFFFNMVTILSMSFSANESIDVSCLSILPVANAGIITVTRHNYKTITTKSQSVVVCQRKIKYTARWPVYFWDFEFLIPQIFVRMEQLPHFKQTSAICFSFMSETSNKCVPTCAVPNLLVLMSRHILQEICYGV